MFIGGTLIRRFDGFRRLLRHAADQIGESLTITDDDMLLCNRVMAALGGPPAASEVRGRMTTDALATLLLFLLTQDLPCRTGLLGQADRVMAKLKSLVHLLGHGAYPIVTGEGPLAFQDVVKELGAHGAVLRPLVRYDQEGEPTAVDATGGAGALKVGPEGGPFTLAILLGAGAGPAPLAPAGDLHPAVLILS